MTSAALSHIELLQTLTLLFVILHTRSTGWRKFTSFPCVSSGMHTYGFLWEVRARVAGIAGLRFDLSVEECVTLWSKIKFIKSNGKDEIKQWFSTLYSCAALSYMTSYNATEPQLKHCYSYQTYIGPQCSFSTVAHVNKPLKSKSVYWHQYNSWWPPCLSCVPSKGDPPPTLESTDLKQLFAPLTQISFCVSVSSSGLCRVENLLSPVLQCGGDVLQQSWPTVDPEYLEVPDFLELSVLVQTFRSFGCNCNVVTGAVYIPRSKALLIYQHLCSLVHWLFHSNSPLSVPWLESKPVIFRRVCDYCALTLVCVRVS